MVDYVEVKKSYLEKAKRECKEKLKKMEEHIDELQRSIIEKETEVSVLRGAADNLSTSNQDLAKELAKDLFFRAETIQKELNEIKDALQKAKENYEKEYLVIRAKMFVIDILLDRY
nr:MAG: hypothetical protein DIU66_10535 [Bacillota bacterium]